MAMKSGFSVDALLRDSFDALAVNDVAQLRHLLQISDQTEVSNDQSLVVLSLRNRLAALLDETACNLRLLRRASGLTGGDLSTATETFRAPSTGSNDGERLWQH